MRIVACVLAILSGIFGLVGGTTTGFFGELLTSFGFNHEITNYGIIAFFISWIIILLGGLSLRFPKPSGWMLIFFSIASFFCGNIFSAPFALLAGIFDVFDKKQTINKRNKENTLNEVLISNNSSLFDQLEQIHGLKTKGVLTEEIYEQQKASILFKIKQNSDNELPNVENGNPFDQKLKTEEVEKNSQKKNVFLRYKVLFIVVGILLFGIVTVSFFFKPSSGIDENAPLIGIDTATLKLDTSLHKVSINNNLYSVYFYEDKFDKRLKEAFANVPLVTIVITEDNSNNPIYIKKIEIDSTKYDYGNGISWSFIKAQGKSFSENGRLYFRIHTHSLAGVGHQFFYFVDFDHQFNITPLFDTEGWSDYYFNKTKDEILLKEYDWEEDEAMDSPHRLKFVKFVWNNYTFVRKELGYTKFKYDTETEETAEAVLSGILKKEPQFNNVIDTSNLIYR